MAAKKTPIKKKRASVKRKPAERVKLAKKILKHMVTGNGHSASASCRYTGVPLPTFLDWVADDPKLTDRYEKAHRAMVEMMADEIKDIADDGTNDYMEQLDKDDVCVGYKLNGEHVQRSRLRVDSRKWLLSKIAQKKYGDKMHLAGDEDNPVIVTEIKRTIIDPK